MDFQSYKQQQTSAFDERAFKSERLHYLWLKCNNDRLIGNFSAVNFTLDTIWDELSGMSKKMGKYEDHKKLISNSDDYVGKTSIIKNKDIYQATIYKALRQKYQELKFIQEDLGLGGKIIPQDEFSMDE